jgi:hypothetical protein
MLGIPAGIPVLVRLAAHPKPRRAASRGLSQRRLKTNDVKRRVVSQPMAMALLKRVPNRNTGSPHIARTAACVLGTHSGHAR